MRSMRQAEYTHRDYIHWDVCAPESVLSGRTYARILVHEDTVEFMASHWTWEKTHLFLDHLSTRLKTGGELKQLSRIDTIIDLC